MKPLFVQTPAGTFVALHHVVMFDIEASGLDEQQRHEVLATTVDGERHLLTSETGRDSRGKAQRYLETLLNDAGFERVQLNLSSQNLPS